MSRLSTARRIVLKVGSSLLIDTHGDAAERVSWYIEELKGSK